MIFAQNTSNNTGVSISGDFYDFNSLYESLHTVVGNEEDHPHLEQPRLRVLDLCYHLRHAIMEDGEILFVDNGINTDVKRFQSVICSDKNIYMKINIIWPEALFLMMVLNELLVLHARTFANNNNTDSVFTNSKTIWDVSIITVRLFQAAIAQCIGETMTQATLTRMINIMNADSLSFNSYLTQYVDTLNYRFIKMSPQKRLKSISVMAKRIAKQDKEYLDLEQQLERDAKQQGCRRNDIQLELDFPEKIPW